jgi:hypothetical protein
MARELGRRGDDRQVKPTNEQSGRAISVRGKIEACRNRGGLVSEL